MAWKQVLLLALSFVVLASSAHNDNVTIHFRHGGDPQQHGGEGNLTTDQGVLISDNQNSLKAGTRGPTLLEDFVLREKIFNFDHERIPERIVHARGSGAHGYFEACLLYTSPSPRD